MYASKIKIDRNPQKVRYHREVELPDGMLTLEDISKHLKEGETFGFQERETSMIGTTLFMNIYGYRLETEIELNERVEKEQKYNENYEKHHAKYGR